ncbi:DNA excision repair protein ERCC-1 [Myripristis murdjan]|uniref:DNA excision repair protein ERCC-1 n=1 Tax=Myripristis murdjan TaxID=586833 RepID=A0A668AYU6_9TELE|nr:DNA excision repair protein ERCC-1 [Myripristis murdjan]
MEKKIFNINLDDSAFTKERPPLKPQFQPSSIGGPSTSATSGSAPQSAGQPLSYAQYIVQSKVSSNPHTERTTKPVQCVGAGADTVKQAANTQYLQSGAGAGASASRGCVTPQVSAGGISNGESAPLGGEKREEGEMTGADQIQTEGQRSEPGLNLGPKPVGSGSSIIVSPRQRGNPILKFVRSVPWEFGEVVPDYVLGQTTCALFLSLRYHNLNPNYIHNRLKQLGQTFTLRVLLIQVDVKDPHHSLKELARICILADCTLILAWSPEEAGRYLETYKSYEKKPADLLKEQVEKDYLSKVTDCLTTVKSVNKTDAITLLSTFSSVEGIISASKEDLALCPGLGPQKARRLYDVLHQPFLKSRRKDS